jgi:hypothetical protein
MDIMNAPLNIPIISWVFKEVCGVELTYVLYFRSKLDM